MRSTGLVNATATGPASSGGRSGRAEPATVSGTGTAWRMRPGLAESSQVRKARCGSGAQVGTFALGTEQAQELDRLRVRRAEPVRHVGVDLGLPTRGETEVPLGEDQPQPPVEDVDPLIALVRLRFGFAAAAAGRDHEL